LVLLRQPVEAVAPALSKADQADQAADLLIIMGLVARAIPLLLALPKEIMEVPQVQRLFMVVAVVVLVQLVQTQLALQLVQVVQALHLLLQAHLYHMQVEVEVLLTPVVHPDPVVQVEVATAHLLQSDHPEQLILEVVVVVVHILVVHIILAEQEAPES
jgi:hypothetical protein